MLVLKKYCAVKQMIRGIGVLSDVDLFSNFKCAEKPSFANCKVGQKRIKAPSGPSSVSGAGDAE